MEISVQSSELIEALSARITSLTVELETTRIALTKSQEAIVMLEAETAPKVQTGAPTATVYDATDL
jgi:hypothetical protein